MAYEAKTTLADSPGKKDVIRNRSVPPTKVNWCLYIPLQCKTVLVSGSYLHPRRPIRQNNVNMKVSESPCSLMQLSTNPT